MEACNILNDLGIDVTDHRTGQALGPSVRPSGNAHPPGGNNVTRNPTGIQQEFNRNSSSYNSSYSHSNHSRNNSNRNKQEHTMPEQEYNDEQLFLLQCKHQLEVLVATGKCKEFIGRNLTFQDLDKIYLQNPNELLRLYRLYETARAAKVNDALSSAALKGYVRLCNYFLPIENSEKLYANLKDDYLLNLELNRWIGYVSNTLGPVIPLLSLGATTISACRLPSEEEEEKKEK